MESNQINNNAPSLSQYFANDPPSLFDEITLSRRATITESTDNVDKSITFHTNQSLIMNNSLPVNNVTASQVGISTITAHTFSGEFKPIDYIENPTELEEDSKISDDVRNFWIKPHCEIGATLLTLPGIQTSNDLPDLIAVAVREHLGENELKQRKILTADSVTQDERGLRSLIAAGCYRAAVNLTGRLLTIYGQGYSRAGQPAKHSPHSLQLWFTRLALLMKLGEYSLLQQEAEPFSQLERPDVYYAFYPEMYPGKTGSIASFSFRLLLAELPVYMGNTVMALNHLINLLNICDGVYDLYKGLKTEGKATPEAVEFWRKRQQRVWHSIINCYLTMKHYDTIDNYFMVHTACTTFAKEERRALFSAWGRIYLQIGDIFGAEQKFAASRRLRTVGSQSDLRDLVDKGLIMVAKNDFQEAFATFQKALPLDPGNTMILNNMGVCLLYAGKLKEAINIYETAINLNPQKSLNENLLVNLSTLYELESNNSKNKKLNLLRLVNIYKPDLSISLDICLKLQTGN